ncbi:hypothetical protein [Streptomyces sp. NPDC001020]
MRRLASGCAETVVTPGDFRDPEQSAFWLDDDLPHMRRWAEDK